MNLRVLAESDLSKTIEGGFGMTVALTAPDGTIITTNKSGTTLKGRITYCQPVINPETGIAVMVDNPVVTLRRSSLSQIPATGENWKISIPESPLENADMKTWLIDTTRSVGQGQNLGTIRLYLIDVEQS